MTSIATSMVTLAAQLLTCSGFVFLPQPTSLQPSIMEQNSKEDGSVSALLYAKASHVGLHLEQDPDESAYEHVVPANLQCKAAIFAAGMPRAGSTMQLNLMVKALNHIGQHSIFPKGRYWDMPKHLKFSREHAAKYYAEEDQKLENSSADDVLLYKSHQFDARMSDLCRSRIVVTVRRHLLDEYMSAVIAFNMSGDVSVDHAIGAIRIWAPSFAAWKRQVLQDHFLVLEYEDMVADIDGAYASIVQHLARGLGKEEVLRSPIPSVAWMADQEQNKQIPSSSHSMSEGLAQACRAAMEGARYNLSGTPEDPTLLGLKWGL